MNIVKFCFFLLFILWNATSIYVSATVAVSKIPHETPAQPTENEVGSQNQLQQAFNTAAKVHDGDCLQYDYDQQFEEFGLQSPTCTDVDLVYTFVNGSDPAHEELQRIYIPLSSPSSLPITTTQDGNRKSRINGNLKASIELNIKSRFRDFHDVIPGASTLMHSILSSRKYAPWIRRIWIVVANTDTQIPSWLDVKNERQNHVINYTIAGDHEAESIPIHFVDHKSIFIPRGKSKWTQEEALPTFNSCAIELQLHKIQGLANCYLYLNDDVLFTKPMSLHDFIDETSGRPYSFSNFQQAPVSPKGQEEWGLKLYHVGRMIQRRTKMKRKDIHLVGHHGHFFIKSIVEELESFYHKEFDETTTTRWRSRKSLWLPFVYSNYLIWKIKSVRKRVHALYHGLNNLSGPEGVKMVFERVRRAHGKKYSWLCLNDLLDENKKNFSETVWQMKVSLDSFLE